MLRRVAEVYETFELFDDGTGCIHQSNFEIIIKAMGGSLTAGMVLSFTVKFIFIVTTDFRENWAHVLSEDNENGIDYIEFVKVILGFDLTWVVELVEF